MSTYDEAIQVGITRPKNMQREAGVIVKGKGASSCNVEGNSDLGTLLGRTRIQNHSIRDESHQNCSGLWALQ